MIEVSKLDNSVKTMTSREIAELTGKDLSHIHRDIRTMLDELTGADDPELDHVCEDRDSRHYTTCFYLPKGLTITLMAGYSVKMRHAIVKRWQELEAQAAPALALPADYIQALESLLASKKAEKQAVEQLALAAPKAAFVDAYVDSTGLKGFRQVAKLLKIKEPLLRAFLKAESIMYLLGGEWCAYQNHIEAGRFEVKTGASEVSGHAFNRSLFTPKGVEWLAGLWAVNNLNGGAA